MKKLFGYIKKGLFSYPAKLALFLVVLGTICGALLALFNNITAPIIEKQKYEEEISQMKVIVPGETTFKPVENFVKQNNVISANIGYVGDEATYVIYKAQEVGFKSTITAIVAVEINTGKILGISVLDQQETAGIGDRIVGADFAIKGVEISTFENSFQPLSGATYSSNGVKKILADAKAQFAQDYPNK